MTKADCQSLERVPVASDWFKMAYKIPHILTYKSTLHISRRGARPQGGGGGGGGGVVGVVGGGVVGGGVCGWWWWLVVVCV